MCQDGAGGLRHGERWCKGGHTSNCQRSTCSPVSLSVMTMTSLEILPPTIHLSSWDMIFLMYALTWSSEETKQFRPSVCCLALPAMSISTGFLEHTKHAEAIFLHTRRDVSDLARVCVCGTECRTNAVKSSAGYTPRWNLGFGRSSVYDSSLYSISERISIQCSAQSMWCSLSDDSSSLAEDAEGGGIQASYRMV